MRVLALLAVAGLILASGCAKSAEETAVEKMIEAQTGGKANVDLSEGGVEIETKDGKMTMTAGESAKVPDSFPEDVYVLDGAKVEVATTIPQGHSLLLTSDQERGAVAEQYKKEMATAGWTQTTSMDMGEQVMLVYEKDERAANIVIATDGREGGTRVTVTVAQK